MAKEHDHPNISPMVHPPVVALMFIVLAPTIGMLLGFFLMVSVTWIFRRWHPSRLDKLFRRLQLVSAGLYSLGHGGNDAQKTAGIIWLLLITAGYSTTSSAVPGWVIVACYITIAFGILNEVFNDGTRSQFAQPPGTHTVRSPGKVLFKERQAATS